MSLKNTIIGLDDITEIFNRLPVHHMNTFLLTSESKIKYKLMENVFDHDKRLLTFRNRLIMSLWRKSIT